MALQIVAGGVRTSLSVGCKVQARDGAHWYNGTVCKTGKGASGAFVEIKFAGFAVTHNRRYTNGDEGVRARLPAAALKLERDSTIYKGAITKRLANGTWPLEKIMQSRKRNKLTEYLARWEVSLRPNHPRQSRP